MAPKKISYVISVKNDQLEIVEYKGRTEDRTLEGILNAEAEDKEFRYTTYESDGKLLLKKVNNTDTNYAEDTSRWAYKINWGEAQYDLREAEIPDYDEVYIEIIYETDNW